MVDFITSVRETFEEVAGLISDLQAAVAAAGHVTTIDDTASASVSTLPRQQVGTSSGTISSGWNLAARARVTETKTYTKVRFCTGTTAPAGLTDFRGGVWDASYNPLATTANSIAIVTAASTVYELDLAAGLALTEGQHVFVGFAVLGTTPGTYRGNASFSGINNLEPAIARARTGWTGGDLLAITTATSAIPWFELI